MCSIDFMTPFYEEDKELKVTKHRLTHWDQGAKYYFITWRMADSLPRKFYARWEATRKEWLQRHSGELSNAEKLEYKYLFANLANPELDKGGGSCALARRQIRCLVTECLFGLNGGEYDLSSFVVMPNHVHVLFQLNEAAVLSKVMQKIKGGSAYEINKALGKKGKFWQTEYFDVIIRSPKQLWYVKDYIRRNPKELTAGTYTLWEKEGGV